MTSQTFHSQTGRIETISTNKGLLAIQNHRYEFDSLGNLEQRQDLKNNVTQSFCYDGLNRIKAARFDGCSSAANDYAYDLFGNIKTKQGVTGIFGYGTKNTGIGSQLAGPHAVTQANGYTYQYDRNGNLTTATKTGAPTKSVVYSPFNTPTSITEGSKWSNIIYGPNQDRIKHSDSNGRVTKYVGGIYEEVTHNGVTQKIHYVGDQILFVQKSTSPSESYQYLHRDHIGSIVAITGDVVNTQADVQYLANGVWGERRFQQWNGPLDDNFVPAGTARGFTDHEHLDSVGLIHMNGRVYDQELGRFLSADPLIQAPHNTQSYNRYSYVFNNPLSFVDPSGFECGKSEDPRVAPGGVTRDCDGFTWYDQSIGTDAWYWAQQNATAHSAAEWNRLTAPMWKRFDDGKITRMEGEVGAAIMALDQNFTQMADVVGGVATLPAGFGSVAGVAAVRVTAAAKSSSFFQKLFGALGTKGEKLCFVEGTLVHTQDGLKPIEEVKVGDLVASKDEFTGEITWKPVIDLFRSFDKQILNVTLVNSVGEEELLGVTEEHPFWVEGLGWTKAAELEERYKISSVNGDVLTVKFIVLDQQLHDTYNFEVADYHTYFVGKQGAWVHNTCRQVFNSIKDSPNFPKGFRSLQNGTTTNTVKNKELLESLRQQEPGKWVKVYKDGYDATGNRASLHYFRSESGKVFDLKTKSYWSNN